MANQSWLASRRLQQVTASKSCVGDQGTDKFVIATKSCRLPVLSQDCQGKRLLHVDTTQMGIFTCPQEQPWIVRPAAAPSQDRREALGPEPRGLQWQYIDLDRSPRQTLVRAAALSALPCSALRNLHPSRQ